MNEPIDTNWKQSSDIKLHLNQAVKRLKKVKISTVEERTNHLIKRATAMNLENKLPSAKTILNIQKMEKMIIVSKTIKYLPSNSTRTSLKTKDIPKNKEII